MADLTPEQIAELQREIDADSGAWDLPGMRQAVLAMARRAAEAERIKAAYSKTLDEHTQYIAELERKLAEATELFQKAFALGMRWQANRCTPEDIEAARAQLQRPEVRAVLEQLGIDPDAPPQPRREET